MLNSQCLSRWGVIGVEGADAVGFLHAQLSNDIASLSENQLRLAGLCTAKGRLLGVFFVLRKADSVMLVCRKDTIAGLVKRLGMFVLRSQCKVSDWSAHYAVHYIAHCTHTDPMQVVWPTPTEAHASLRAWNQQLPGFFISPRGDTPSNPEADTAFELALFHLGIPYIEQQAVELFIPQAVNFDLLGGISFSKGCYPGQEVVARSHYLGKVKRRTFKALATTGPALAVGGDVWQTGKENEPVGQVVTCVAHQGTQYVLLELPIEAVETEGAAFFCKTESGNVQLSVHAPPYDTHQKGNQFEAS